MTPEQHVLACALKVEQLHGANSPVHIAERIGALALAGDADGVEMWRKIAAAYTSLQPDRDALPS